jgi:metallo-beta-lactamase class B
LGCYNRGALEEINVFLQIGNKGENMKIDNTMAFSPAKKPPINTARPGLPPWEISGGLADFTPMVPTRLFDRFYYVGTKSVGAYIVDTTDGLIMIDTGWSEKDCALFVEDMKKLGLDPHDIKVILLTHEHVDHYGGVPYLKSQVCPEAKVALSLLGWNYMMTRPIEAAFGSPRPKSVDIFLRDGDEIEQGHSAIRVVATPGHTPGCMSFIVPVTDKGEPHSVGIMGGVAVPFNWNEAFLYHSSIDYFMGFSRRSGCDIGLGTHAAYLQAVMESLRSRPRSEPNPLIIGTERFETEYLQRYRDQFLATAERLPPEIPAISTLTK